MDEAPGSNVFMTRDQVGRALLVCIVLGKRLDIPPAEQRAARAKDAPEPAL